MLASGTASQSTSAIVASGIANEAAAACSAGVMSGGRLKNEPFPADTGGDPCLPIAAATAADAEARCLSTDACVAARVAWRCF